MPRPRRGEIVYADVLDPQSRNPKRRPLVIISSDKDIPEGGTFLAVAITGTIPKPTPDDYVELPWHPERRSQTKLSKRSAAMCRWLEELQEENIHEVCGRVPDRLMEVILAKVNALPDE